MSDFFKPPGSGSHLPRKRRRRIRKKPRPAGDIQVTCPWCGEELRVESRWIGYTVSCPFCEDRFIAEAPSDSSASLSPVQQTPKKKPRRRKRRKSSRLRIRPRRGGEKDPPSETPPYQEELQVEREDDYDEISPDAPTQYTPPPDTGGLKKCPYCAEYIKAEAILCKHCRSRLDE